MQYFKLKELCTTSTGLNNIPTWEAVENLKILVINLLDPLRAMWGHPLPITSGYRSPDVNKRVGGVTNSQHIDGRAVDIDVGTLEENRRLFDFISTVGLSFDQLILENGGQWVHVSYNVNNNRRMIIKK